MIRSRAANIQSGWKSILFAFTVAACDESEYIVSLVFEMIDSIVNKNFYLISDLFFVDLVNCLAAHARHSVVKELSIKAIKHINLCADYLAKGHVIKFDDMPLTAPKTDPTARIDSAEMSGDGVVNGSEHNGFMFTDQNETHLKFWFPILNALSHTSNHPHLNVRSASVKQLFAILRSYGRMFNDNMWTMIFRGEIEGCGERGMGGENERISKKGECKNVRISKNREGKKNMMEKVKVGGGERKKRN
jgi:hypothetical protein